MDIADAIFEFRSERCVYRTLEVSDVGRNYVSWLNSPDVNAFLDARLRTNTMTNVEKDVLENLKSQSSLLFGIFANEPGGGVHIGNIRFSAINLHHGIAEIGYMIGNSSYWRRGYGSEALCSASEWSFQVLNLAKVTAGIYASNEASKRTLLRCGFVQEAVLRAHLQYNDNDRMDYLRFAKFSSKLVD